VKDLLRAPVLDERAINGVQNLKRGLGDGLRGLACLHSRDEIIPENPRGFGVREERLKSIADFNPGFVILIENRKQNAVVFLALTDLPFLENAIREIVQILAIQAIEDRDHNLLAGGAIMLDEQRLKCTRCLLV
jgi:hypothetical protein